MTGNFGVEYVQTTAGDRFDLTIRLSFTSEELAELIDSCVDAMATADGLAERSGLDRAEREFRDHWGA